MLIYAFEDYRQWLAHWLKESPKGGHGAALRLSQALGISNVLISQILSGNRNLQLEQAYKLAKYTHLNKKETQFLIVMVLYASAGTTELAEYWLSQIRELSQKAREIKEHVKTDLELDEVARAEFYSHWIYSAVRLSTDIPGRHDPESIASSLGLKVESVTNILEFLVRHQLCTLSNGQYKMGGRSTFLERDSPWIYSRQLQWRQKAIQKMNEMDPKSVFYTGPMVISAKDFSWISENLIKKAIGEASKRAVTSSSENLACLNIDWFML